MKSGWKTFWAAMLVIVILAMVSWIYAIEDFGWDTFFFLMIAVTTIMGAVYCVTSKEVVHSALYMALTFAGVGFTFFFLEATLLGILQILVYLGAISILFVFGIMVTKKKLPGDTGTCPVFTDEEECK